MSRLIALGALLAALVCPAAAGAAPLFGYHSNNWRETPPPVTADQAASLAKADGANVQRYLFDWQYVEKTQGVRNQVDLQPYDDMYNALTARGIKPLIVLMDAPTWARDTGESACTGNCHVPPGHLHMAAWQNIAAFVATRYPQAAIEVWNEPNLKEFWQTRSGVDPVYFEQVQQNAYQAIKQAHSSTTVVAGGLNNNQVDATVPGGSLSLQTFLDRFYTAGGKPYMDALSFHPYPTNTSLGAGSIFQKSFDEVHSVEQKDGDTGRRLWVTEVGLSTSGSPPQSTLQQQSDTLVGIYRKVQAMPDVDALLVHTLVEPPGDPSTSTAPGFGVITRNLTPKPAYCALAAERGVAKPSGCP